MKKLYCVICGKYRKFEKPKISEKTLAVSARMKMKIFKEENSIMILQILGYYN